MVKRVKYIPQLLQTECGLVNIAMLSRYYGKYVSLNDLRIHIKPGRDGISIRNMVKILEELDFDCKIYKAGTKALGLVKLPAILYVDNNHFVTLEKIKKGKYYVVDPALGRVVYQEKEFSEKFSNILIEAKPNKNFETKKREESTWACYLPLLKKSKGRIIKVTCLSATTYFFNMLITSFIQKFIDNSIDIKGNVVVTMMGVLLAFALVKFLNSTQSVYLKANLYQDFSECTYDHLINAPYSYFESRSYGSLSYSLESISIIKNMYAEKMVDFFISLGGILVLLSYLYSISPLLCIIVTVSLSLVYVALKIFSQKVLLLNQLEISNMAKLQEIQLDILYSIFNIKITGIQEQIYKLWNDNFKVTNERTKARDRMQGYYTTMSSIIQTVLPLIIIFVGVGAVNHGYWTLGKVMASYTVTSLIAGYAIGIFTTMNYFNLAEQYLERVKDITDQEYESNGEITFEADKFEKIEFENVSFRYSPQSEDVIRNVSFEILKGQKIAIVGKSGCGKSTLSKLMLALYPATQGKILINGIDIDKYEKNSLRRSFGVVPQDTSLENKTIYQNIKMNRTNLEDEDIVAACKRAHIDKDIEDMPMKYETLISDMGMNLSGGQRQRILLARALASKPSIVVFDEATSSLDAINESSISEGLREGAFTQIVIAHRLTTIIDSDVIFVFDEGRIIEKGTHMELMNKKGYYYDLYKRNALNNE